MAQISVRPTEVQKKKKLLHFLTDARVHLGMNVLRSPSYCHLPPNYICCIVPCGVHL